MGAPEQRSGTGTVGCDAGLASPAGRALPSSTSARGVPVRVIHEKGIKSKLYGDELYYAACS